MYRRKRNIVSRVLTIRLFCGPFIVDPWCCCCLCCLSPYSMMTTTYDRRDSVCIIYLLLYASLLCLTVLFCTQVALGDFSLAHRWECANALSARNSASVKDHYIHSSRPNSPIFFIQGTVRACMTQPTNTH